MRYSKINSNKLNVSSLRFKSLSMELAHYNINFIDKDYGCQV